MKFKDLSLLFTLGLITILYVLINLLSYLLIEKKLILVLGTVYIVFWFTTWLCQTFL